MIVLISNMIESGITQELTPLGVVQFTIYNFIDDGKPASFKTINEEAGRMYPGVDYILNCKIESYFRSHPSHHDKSAIITGDAYKILQRDPRSVEAMQRWYRNTPRPMLTEGENASPERPKSGI